MINSFYKLISLLLLSFFFGLILVNPYLSIPPFLFIVFFAFYSYAFRAILTNHYSIRTLFHKIPTISNHLTFSSSFLPLGLAFIGSGWIYSYVHSIGLMGIWIALIFFMLIFFSSLFLLLEKNSHEKF